MVRPPSESENGVKKGPWTPEEDQLLIEYIQKHGHANWRALPDGAGLNRCGKSCRLRWNNYLRPDIKRGKFSGEEEGLIINLHSILGNKWSQIAAHLPGRTDNEIKNFWNTCIRKKLLQKGVDPKTHKPILDHNLLANLTQLISTSNLGNLMNPWGHYGQLGNIQLLHNLLQVINVNPVPNIEVNNHLGPYNYQYDMINSAQNSFKYTDEAASPFASPHGFFVCGFRPEITNANVNSLSCTACDITPTENQLPPLVPDTSETSNANKMENMEPTNIPSNSSNSMNIFADLEKLMDGKANSTSFWKDVLEYNNLL